MKVKTRGALRRVWKREFERRGITWCEARLEGCWHRVDGFAHAKKSDELKPEEFNKVVAACNVCHRTLDEGMSHKDMELMVDLIIEMSDWPTRQDDLNKMTKAWKQYE
jgi:hypothetical protein